MSLHEFDFDCSITVVDLRTQTSSAHHDEESSIILTQQWFDTFHPQHEVDQQELHLSDSSTVIASSSSSSSSSSSVSTDHTTITVVSEGIPNMSRNLLSKATRVTSAAIQPARSLSPLPPPPRKTTVSVSIATSIDTAAVKGTTDTTSTLKGTKRKAELPQSSVSSSTIEARLQSWRENKQPPVNVNKQQETRKVSSKLHKGKVATQQRQQQQEDDMKELLSMHNQRFKPTASYEPSRHSVRETRKWERETGNFHTLNLTLLLTPWSLYM
jgi:hypothetical protein